VSTKTAQPIERFQAIAESGKVITILVLQKYDTVEEFSAERQTVPATKRMVTTTGEPVRQINESTFETLVGAEIVRFEK
jgi:uncharacterized protein with HEPN domain